MLKEQVKLVAEWCALGVELVGVTVIAATALVALARSAAGLFRAPHGMGWPGGIRRSLGRGILLGLEFLVAADIIHTVAVELTFESVAVLGLIVLIRTFLSFTMELELNGRWPWQSAPEETGSGRRDG